MAWSSPSRWTASESGEMMPWTPDHYSSNIILRCENEFRIVKRPPTYTDALKAVYTHFPCMKPTATVKLSASFDNTWPEGVSAFSPVTSDTWRFMGPNVSVLLAEADPGSGRPYTKLNTQQTFGVRMSALFAGSRRPFQLTIVRQGEPSTTFTLSVSYETSASQLFKLVAAHEDMEEDDFDLVFGDQCLERSRQPLTAAGMENGATIKMELILGGYKPVIYLFPPLPLRASVSLSLSPSWSFDVIYPTANIKDTSRTNGYPQTVQWDVDAMPSGDLVDRGTDVQVSYLFWEARTNRSTTVQECPATSFIPGSSTCSPTDCVVIPQSGLLKYLDTSLKALGLHTEARTSFITYWLPVFQKHPYIALRFVPQPAFETAAPLTVEPKPDAVTRVFMLFKGLLGLPDSEWDQAVERAEEDVTRWKEIVGIDEEKQADPTLFRVLEWGGMEVYA